MDFEEWFNSLELDNWTNKKYMHDAFEAGQQSKQEKIDEITKQRDSFIKAHHIAMDDVCNLIAGRDALQKRIDEALELINNQHDTSTIKFVRHAINKILKGESK